MLAFVLFILGFVILIKAADYFVDSATKIAKIFRVSEIIIGATIVSIGTTLPETIVSATGAFKGLGSMAYGNAIGSIICNTSLISALTMVFLPGEVNKKKIKQPIIFFFSAYAVYLLFAIFQKEFTRVSGLILVCIFAIFVGTIIYTSSKEENEKKEVVESNKKKMYVLKQILTLILSAIAIAFGSNLLVDNGTIIAIALGVPTQVVAITMVALGTSLPELMTAVTAIVKKHRELSIGNIIGANFLNLVTVTGIAAIVRPFDVPSEKLINDINASFIVDIPLVCFVMLIMCLPPLLKGKTYRFQGILLLVIYFAYIAFQFAF